MSEYLIFQILLGGMPPDPPSISMLCMLIVLHTIYIIAINQDPPLQNSGSAPGTSIRVVGSHEMWAALIQKFLYG